MRLLELTQDERAWLAAPLTAEDGLAVRLERALENTLRARLRCAVRIEPLVAQPPAVAPAAPVWQIDGALAALWLVRRLGGRFTGGTAPFMPAGLRAALDEVLAERWLDRPEAGRTPAAFAWAITADGATATLGLELPRAARAMTGWARRIVGGCAA